MRRRGRKVLRWQVAAGLIYGQVKKCYRQRKLVKVRHGLASWNRGRPPSRLTRDGLLRPAEHGFHRTGESDHPAWDRCVGSSHLGDRAAVPTPVGHSRVAARLLSFCTSSRSAAGEAHAAPRTRGQTIGATLPSTDTGDGCGENPSKMDCARGALVPLAQGFPLSAMQAGCERSVKSRGSR